MSHLGALIEFIQSLCLKDGEINNTLKEIDKMNKENNKLEYQLEEFNREHVRLQIEIHNLETITSFTDTSAIQNLNQASKQMYRDCTELKKVVEKIDFTKILQCYHMEMETKCRTEWQPIQDCFAKTLKWQEKMEQRHIVQKYRKAEAMYQEAELAKNNQQKSMQKTLKQSLQLINQTMERRNSLILVLIKGSKDLHDFNAKMKQLNQYHAYIEGLREEKLKIENQLEQRHFMAFNTTLNLNSYQNFSTTLKPNTGKCKFMMPQLPTFADFLERFNQTEKLAHVTSTENTNNICPKSILHTSKQLSTTKQTKSVHFKMQLEEYHEDMTQNNRESKHDIETMVLQPQTTLEISQQRENNLQETKNIKNTSYIEIVDLSTPIEISMETVMENQDNSKTENQLDKNPVIQDCIVFKTPFPIQEVLHKQNDESISSNTKVSSSKDVSGTYSSGSSHSDIKEILNTTKISSYEEFLNVSSSGEDSPKLSMKSSNKNEKASDSEDFDEFFKHNTSLLFSSKNPEEIKKPSNFGTNETSVSAEQDFLDFATNKSFDFDNDNNMTDTYNAGNMDFM